MKPSSALIVAISLAVLLCAALLYLGIQLAADTREIKQLKAANTAVEAHMASVQGALDGFKHDLKQY
ncbi:MAG TPA: hypothetical protein VKG78_09980, partial [Opitutaceae bacterium]|nr:hypothetical protein [Opitutaceae bacterium]